MARELTHAFFPPHEGDWWASHSGSDSFLEDQICDLAEHRRLARLPRLESVVLPPAKFAEVARRLCVRIELDGDVPFFELRTMVNRLVIRVEGNIGKESRMSWSCYMKGTKEDVKASVEQSLDTSAKNYDSYGTDIGREEAEDCRNAKRAILSALDTMVLDADHWAKDGYIADVEAYGSRSTGSVTLHAVVTKKPKSPAAP